MGNTVIKDFLHNKEDPTGYLPNFINPELFNHIQYLNDRWINLAPEKAKDYSQMFDWSNVQTTANLEQVEENIQNQETKEKLLVGMLPKSVSPDLLNPSFFDEVQTSFSPGAVSQFRDFQNQRFLVLSQIFGILQRARKKDQNIGNILKQAAKFDLPKAAEVGIRSGVHLIISLLREAAEHNSKLKDETLDFLIDLFTEVKPLSLWGSKQIDVVLDRSLHGVSDYLEEVILSEKTSHPSKCKALKVLFSLGLLRGSLPNLLSVVSLLRRLKLEVDLSHELKLLKLENPQASIDFEQRVQSSSKIYFQSNVKADAPSGDKSPYVSLTTDGKFLYIHSEVEGLLKVGTGYGFTMLGKVYKHKRDYRLKERGSIAYILGKLYYRSAKIAPAPAIELDPETLEETGAPIHFDALAPNCIFAEMTNPEIEFPVLSADADQKSNNQKQDATSGGSGSQNATTTSTNAKENVKSPTKTGPSKTAAQNKRDIRLMRPAQRSPMFTEGRYIYIISQWTVDTRAGRASGADSDDEDEGEQEMKQARYGVDIYDPLLDFEHVRSVELWVPKAPDQKVSVAPISIKALDMCSFTTNGSQLLIGMPKNCDDTPNEQKYKYFSLEDGKLIKANSNATANHFSTVCYDIYNNRVWSINDTKKSFDLVSCLKNASIPENFTYPEDSSLFKPYDNMRIIDMAAEDISGVQKNRTEVSIKKEQEEHHKEEIQLLMSLGFQVTSEKPQADALLLTGEKSFTELQNNSAQLFILANIARLSERYASLDFSDSTDLVGNIRKPYCIHLIDKTFNYLEEFLDTYSRSFFSPKSDEEPTDEENADQCSFLCTLRILKYNLAALEHFADHLKKLGLKVVNQEFAEKLEKLIWKILEMKPRASKDYDELRQAIYEEALEILKHTLSIIYPKISKMLSVLKNCFGDLKSKLNRDIAIAILSWLKSKDHIARLVTEAIDSAESAQVTEDLQYLVNNAVNLEVQQFTNYLNGLTKFSNNEQFQPDELITVSMSFLLKFQNETLYQLGEKIQEKAMESGPAQDLVAFLTEALSKNAILINLEIQSTLTKIVPLIRDYHEALELQRKEEEEAKAALEKDKKGAKQKKKEKGPSKEELIEKTTSDFWAFIMDQFTVKVLFSQALSLQVTALSMLSSNFMVAARTLKHMTALLASLNHLYETRNKLNKSQQEKLISQIMEKAVVYESEHPPAINAKKKEQICIPGARQLRISFDPRCDLKQNCDYLQFFKDEKLKEKITEPMTKSGENSTFPTQDIIIKGDNFWYNFHRDSCRNAQWGYKFTVYATLNDQQIEGDWVASFHRTVTWLASKCAAQLMNGSALQQAMLADEEQRYNALLNSKLFSGGMEKCYFSGGKEGVWSQLGDIINDFQAGHLSEYLSGEMTLEEKNEEEFLNSIITPGLDPQMDKTLDFIQKNFAKEALWANLGGDNGSRLVRAAYAVIIKHGGLIHDLQEAMLEVEVEDGKGKLSPNLKNLIKKWGAASRMRPWLVEKRKDIDDLEERRKQQQVATKKVKKPEPEKIETETSKKDKTKRRGRRTKDEPEEEKREEPKMVEETKEEEEPISQGTMQVRDTEEIINRMIDQIVKKAQFLCQLIPSQHWQQDKTEKKEKQLLFRSTSKRDEEVNKEEEWKRRLQQWKSVRQAKQVFKSLEDETQEIQQSLTTSVLLCLQSAVSIRRLRKQVESAYLRAICRTIGLNALTSILLGVQNSVFREDVVGWLSSSLRGSENKLYHFTDNLQGCGHYLESTVNTAFKNLIVVIVKSMATSSSPDEIKCMLDSLKWKYHGDDHMFLAEIDIFNILKGHESQALLRSAWGRSMNAARLGNVDSDLVKKLLKLFETIVILCVGKLNWTRHESAANSSKKDKLPALERHVSTIDEYSVEILIRQAFAVIFGELENADKDYSSSTGIDWKIYLRYLRKKQLEEERKKKQQATDVKKPSTSLFEDIDVDDDMGFDDFSYRPTSRRQAAATTTATTRVEPTSDDDAEFVEELLEEEKTAFEKEEETKEEKKEGEEEMTAEQKKKLRRKQLINDMLKQEEKIIKESTNKLYNPDFLYRLLALIYKCVAMGNDSVSMVVGNPKYIAILFSLLKHSPPNHQILLLKIISTLFETLPPELFIDSGHEYVKLSASNSLGNVKDDADGDSRIINHFLDILLQTRQKVFVEGTNHPGIYTVSAEIIDLMRTLLHHPHWTKYIIKWLQGALQDTNEIAKQTALSILGGEFNGLRFGGRITINAMNNYELFEDNILLKQGWEDSRESATILGFTFDYKEKLPLEEKQKRDALKPEEKAKYKMKYSIGSIQDSNNPVCLIDSSINKETLNFTTIELTSVNRSNCSATDGVAFPIESFELSKNLGVLLPIFEWALSAEPKNKTKDLYTQALALKSLNSFATVPENSFLLTSSHMKLVEKILDLATSPVVSKELTNLEISEERLYRLLEKCCETATSMDELPIMAVTVKNNELEVLLGKDLKCIRYSVQSGFNMDKVSNKHFEAVVVNNPKELASRSYLKDYLENKAIIMNLEDINSEKYPDIVLSAKIVITCNFDMAKFAEYYDKVLNKKKTTEEEIKPAGEETMMIQEEESKSSKGPARLPNCLISMNDRAFDQLLVEYERQKNAEHKNVFEQADTLKELVEFGFPKEICETYIRENPKVNLDIMISDIAKIIEENAIAESKLKEKLSKAMKTTTAPRKPTAQGQGKKEEKSNTTQGNIEIEEEKKGEQQGGAPEIQLSKGKPQTEDKDAPMKIGGGLAEDEEEKKGDEKEGAKKKTEEEELIEKEKEFKLKMMKAAEFASGGQPKQDIDDPTGQDKKTEGAEETIEEIKIEEAPAKDAAPDSEDDEVVKQELDFDIEKEDANPCFRVKGEKELQNLADEKNKLYDDLIDFESMNKIGRLVLFKKLTHNLSVFYARRIIIHILENWSDDSKVVFVTDKTLFPKFLRFLKLTTVEATFSSTNFCNNHLINKVEKILHKLLSKESRIGGESAFNEVFFDQVIMNPIVSIENEFGIRLNKILGADDKSNKKKKSARRKKIKVNQKFYTGSISNENDIENPSLDYSLWMAQVMLLSPAEETSKKVYRLDLLYLLLGIIPSIRNNRSLLWGVLIFALNMIDKFTTKPDLLDVKDARILEHPNVKLLHDFFDALKDKEKVDALSRRTQIISEILVNLNRLQRLIDQRPESKAPEGSKLDLNQFRNIENLTDVVEMMQNYQDNKSLLASTWLQMSSELLKNEQKVIDGDHFYYKNLHTFKVVMPFAAECSIKFSEDCQADPGDSLILSSDPNGEFSSEKIAGLFANKTKNYPTGTFYVHFPVRGADVIAFGANESNQINSDMTVKGPVCLEDFSYWNVAAIDGGDQHTMILNKNGELWACGAGIQTGLPNGGKNLAQVAAKDKVRLFSCGSNFSIFITEQNEVYGVGSNAEGRLGLNYNSGTAYPQLIDFSPLRTVKSLSCGYAHTLLCTTEGVAYACGQNDYGQLGIVDDSGNKISGVQSLRVVNSLNKKQTIRVSAGHSFSLAIAREKGGKNYVFACGEKAGGKLGLGKGTTGTSQHSFISIPALEDAGVTQIHCKRRHSIVITQTGKIYSWGCGDQGQLGHGDFDNQYAPKLMEFFSDMKVISAITGSSFTAIIAKGKDDANNKLYLTGVNPKHKADDKVSLPVIVESFEDKSVSKVFGGANHIFAITTPMNIPAVRDIHKLKCSLTGESPIKGGIYVDILNGNKIYSASAAESPDHKFKMPDLLLYSQEALSSLEKVIWPTLPAPLDDYLEKVEPNDKLEFGVNCGMTGEPIKGVCFVSVHAYENEPLRFLSQNAAFKIQENQVSQTLYYRITRPIKKGKSLPVFPRTLFSAQSETFGYQMKVTPKYNEKGHEYMINKYKESFDAFYGDMKDLKPEVDEQLVDLINTVAQKLEKSVFDLSENINFPRDEVNLRTAIEKCSSDFLKKRFQILKNFNQKFKSLLPYIDFSAKKDTTRFRNIYAQASVYIFWDVKSELFEKLLAKDAKSSSNPKIRVNRMKASKFIAKGKPDHTGEFTVFGQIYQHFKSAGYSCFKISKDQNPFTVQFVGEASIDAGGPYREAVSQLCTELQSGALPLLIPSPNQKNDSGQFREKWVLNPSANSLIHLQMYEFLGVIMGCSIRTRNFLNLDLPSMVWKQLVDVPVNRKDLENIDRYLIQCLDDIINIHKKGVDENSFSEIIQEKFVTTLSDGSEIELIPGGRSKIVTFDARLEWAELVEKARLNEFKKQAEAIRKGLCLIVPEGVLNLLTWRELETIVCGKPILDIDLLKENTVYRGVSETDPVIEFFWRALTEFTPEERSMYLRFVWGRSRLPLTSKDFPMKHTVEMLRKGSVDPDIMLPVAHTCFFQIELPKYTSYEILRDKLRYAIKNCQAIDTDGRAYDIWDEDD